jgi:hypothetical protein
MATLPTFAEQFESAIALTGERMLPYFRFAHLPVEQLRDVSQQFAAMAVFIVEHVPQSAERTVCLRKLLEAKDAGVRAALP